MLSKHHLTPLLFVVQVSFYILVLSQEHISVTAEYNRAMSPLVFTNSYPLDHTKSKYTND